jgi:histidine ammonia-lyase
MYGAQALDFRRPKRTTDFLEEVHAWIRSRVDHVEEDRIFSSDMKVLFNALASGEFQQMIDKTSQKLNINLDQIN